MSSNTSSHEEFGANNTAYCQCGAKYTTSTNTSTTSTNTSTTSTNTNPITPTNVWRLYSNHNAVVFTPGVATRKK
ncbi:unnamed protein product [Parnassius mnemosyne]|uniref:Uncharacterized protein n=1 Tax=Parnassius mnemosyne TaxID=213953 RepID=A0AAV1M8F9_9NEOP